MSEESEKEKEKERVKEKEKEKERERDRDRRDTQQAARGTEAHKRKQEDRSDPISRELAYHETALIEARKAQIPARPHPHH